MSTERLKFFSVWSLGGCGEEKHYIRKWATELVWVVLRLFAQFAKFILRLPGRPSVFLAGLPPRQTFFLLRERV